MRILSVDGGGYLGLAVGSLLHGLEMHFKTSCHARFDLFCGTSTGAIIALGMASGLTAHQIVGLYEELGVKVFGAGGKVSRSFKFAKSLVTSKYGNSELKQALDAAFQDMTLGDLRQSGKRAVIPAFCVTNGSPRIFNTGQAPDQTMHDGYRIADIALASSAAPSYFPMVKLERPAPQTGAEVFCDGGVVANHPAMIGFAEALGRLRTPPGDISLLSISTPRVDLSRPLAVKGRLSRGLLGWAPSLSSAFIDSGSAMMHEALNRIVDAFPEPRPRYQRLQLDNKKGLPMDLASDDARIVLTQIGTEAAAKADVRSDLRPFFV